MSIDLDFDGFKTMRLFLHQDDASLRASCKESFTVFVSELLV
jgi:hypothetical protein